ncbi:4-galactosyl-N-acetylglucosaminide 3-alpha-L-fucosyltransferase 9-like [Hoplias malabaricus]|uniref:4-galactosyl-N-acetylglucosaminide 3-alpha-L-fucosyltransferase 9-like n=1 Tax=Hoplias malabaricus TaxID=27720 RepID=UPI003461B440
MRSTTLSGHFRHLVITGILVICFTAIFYTYYKLTMGWMPCTEELRPDVCTKACLKVLNVENNTQIFTHGTENTKKATQAIKTVEAGKDHVSEIVVLIWYWPFGEHFDLNSCESIYGIKGCRLTDDQGQLDKAHAVMFHIRDIRGDLPSLLKISRPPRQKWVWMDMESPTYSPHLIRAADLFNLTSNYRRDSDIWVPYGRLIEISDKDEPFQMPQKDKLVCWIVSHWNVNHKRTGFFNEFRKHINVEGYGKHFNRLIDPQDYNKVMSSCKFYLSFENSIHKYYITEKVFNPMKLGTVPVVLGPPRENYEELIPKDSFIHVDDFKTPQKLAEHLKALDQNQEMYERFFSWRKDYVAKSSVFGQEHACYICDHLRKHKSFSIVKDVNKWYFS